MTNEELKKKICDIIAPYVSAYGDDERIADALIAAGIGDVKEAEHRAEVAERELERYTVLIKPLEAENARLNHLAARAKRALKDL